MIANIHSCNLGAGKYLKAPSFCRQGNQGLGRGSELLTDLKQNPAPGPVFFRTSASHLLVGVRFHCRSLRLSLLLEVGLG